MAHDRKREDGADVQRPTPAGDPVWWQRLMLWATGVGWADIALLAWVAMVAKRARAALVTLGQRAHPGRAGHHRRKRLVGRRP